MIKSVLFFIIILVLFSLLADSLNVIPKNISTSSKQISNNETKQNNNFTNTLWYIIGSPIIGWIIGIFTQKIISKKTYKKNRLSNMAFQIREILLEDKERLMNLDAFDNFKAGNIVVDNINKINPLIINFLYYTDIVDSEKIKRHYEKYIENYKEKTELWGVEFSENGIRKINKKPTKFVNNNTRNALKKAIRDMDNLIDDIKHL